MLSVHEAQRRILDALAPLAAEVVGLDDGLGRVLAEDLAARVTQPPAAVSAMDGYAVRAADTADPPQRLTVVGETAAGGAMAPVLAPDEARRIFTGAPLPEGADAVVIQEDAERSGDLITVRAAARRGDYVRPAGLDFRAGDLGLRAGRRLTARDLGLAAAMNHPWLRVHRRARVAILGTGDEIVLPGEPLGPNQIVSSNGFALSAAVRACGGEALHLGVAPDDRDRLGERIAAARGCDLLVTAGGASVGAHDLVQDALRAQGAELDFWKIAMRPGKPLMFGRLGPTPVLGLPGNPVSAMVCAIVFLAPALARLHGQPGEVPRRTVRLGTAVAANGPREAYLRARLEHGAMDDAPRAVPLENQDSAVLSGLADADALLIRPPYASAAETGETAEAVPLDGGAPLL